MASDSSSNPVPENAGTANEHEVPASNLTTHKTNIMEYVERAKPEALKLELVRKLREKEQMLASVVEKKKNGPLQLLDLPMDVLKVIVKEVSDKQAE